MPTVNTVGLVANRALQQSTRTSLDPASVTMPGMPVGSSPIAWPTNARRTRTVVGDPKANKSAGVKLCERWGRELRELVFVAALPGPFFASPNWWRSACIDALQV